MDYAMEYVCMSELYDIAMESEFDDHMAKHSKNIATKIWGIISWIGKKIWQGINWLLDKIFKSRVKKRKAREEAAKKEAEVNHPSGGGLSDEWITVKKQSDSGREYEVTMLKKDYEYDQRLDDLELIARRRSPAEDVSSATTGSSALRQGLKAPNANRTKLLELYHGQRSYNNAVTDFRSITHREYCTLMEMSRSMESYIRDISEILKNPTRINDRKKLLTDMTEHHDRFVQKLDDSHALIDETFNKIPQELQSTIVPTAIIWSDERYIKPLQRWLTNVRGYADKIRKITDAATPKSDDPDYLKDAKTLLQVANETIQNMSRVVNFITSTEYHPL